MIPSERAWNADENWGIKHALKNFLSKVMRVQSFLMTSSQGFPGKTEKAHNFATNWPNLMFYISIHVRIRRSFSWCCLSSIESFERYEIFKINFSLCSLVRIVQRFALKILKSNLQYLVRFDTFVVVWAAPSERRPNSDMDPYIKHQIWSTGSEIMSFFSFAWKGLWWRHQKTLDPHNFW